VAEEGSDEDYIVGQILGMEGYFRGYETEIHFVTDAELSASHTSFAHRGRLFALGSSGRYREVRHSLYLDLDVGSNPDLTASIMLAGVRAVAKIKEDGGLGAYSPFDVPPSYFAPLSGENVNKYL
jgi:diaminopimelate dehydrogenase